MANTMKATVISELGRPLVIQEVPIPQPNENQILVRIATAIVP
jgi:propanol-preferring alcohol dehydrogenase